MRITGTFTPICIRLSKGRSLM